MEFRKIDETNRAECEALKAEKEQELFVADNVRSLAEASQDEGLYTLGIYDGDTMVGFLLYDYDETYPGWSLSRFMIGRQFQGRGYGKRAAVEFLSYFRARHSADTLYISVSLDNTAARNMYAALGFRDIGETEYDYDGLHFREMQMVKEF